MKKSRETLFSPLGTLSSRILYRSVFLCVCPAAKASYMCVRVSVQDTRDKSYKEKETRMRECPGSPTLFSLAYYKCWYFDLQLLCSPDEFSFPSWPIVSPYTMSLSETYKLFLTTFFLRNILSFSIWKISIFGRTGRLLFARVLVNFIRLFYLIYLYILIIEYLHEWVIYALLFSYYFKY